MPVEHEPIPAAIDYLIKNMTDPNVDVWRRQPFRQRLVKMRDLIDEKIAKYDIEYSKANRNVTPFKRVSK